MAHLLAPTATNPIIHRDLTQSELPYGQRRLGQWGAPPLQLPLRTGVWELDAHVARRDALQRSAAGTALLGQAMDLELDGEPCRCRVLRSRYAASGALEYQLLPLGAVGDVLGAHSSEVNRLFRRRFVSDRAVWHADVFGTARQLRSKQPPGERVAPVRPAAAVWAVLCHGGDGLPAATTVQAPAASSGAGSRLRQQTRPPPGMHDGHSLLRTISAEAALRFHGVDDCIYRDLRR